MGLKRKYRISADDGTGKAGELLGFAEKHLTIREQLTIYRDEQRTETLVTVRESSQGWLAALTGYEAYDRDDRLLGSFGVVVKKSINRTTWQLEQPGLGRFTGTERSTATARVRRLVAVAGALGEIVSALMKYHFDFECDGTPVLSIEKPKVLDDWYKLTVREDAMNRQLVFALAIAMEARQRH